ncbi:MAG: glycerol-3-phosphate 1-O-acyltransferase PlsY [Desulfurivibrionaceae bacterium]|nr:glycerol-3-phosphate 1-O-acyltransferase PlsY [Desulfurivibrionaceae bacterium]
MQYLLLVFGYLVGSIPFGLLYGRLAGVDVRGRGSGNIGATNVNRLLGKKLGFLTLASDLLKGMLPMLIAALLLGSRPDAELLIILTGLAAFAGHCWPVYLRFRGGKGVATALGIFLYLAPLPTLGAIAVFAATVGLSGYVSLGSIAAALSMPVIIALAGGAAALLPVSTAIAAVIVFKHWDNIGRLRRGEEKSWKGKGHGETE